MFLKENYDYSDIMERPRLVGLSVTPCDTSKIFFELVAA